MPVPTEEELSKTTPDERIKRLRELADERKKELEDTRKKVEEELAAAEQLISRSEEEIDEEEQAIDKAREKLRDLRFTEEENLEERLAKEQDQSKPSQDSGALYARNQASDLYNTLPGAIGELERLYDQKNWNQDDVRNYNQAKEQLERVQQYNLTSDQLAEELGLGMSILNKMRYRT